MPSYESRALGPSHAAGLVVGDRAFHAGTARQRRNLQLTRGMGRTGGTTPARRPAGLLQRVRTGLGDLRVLFGRYSGDANSTNDHAINDDWDPAFKWTRVCKRQQAEVCAALRHEILEHLGRTPVENSGVPFLGARPDTTELRPVEAVQCPHVPA